MRNNNTLKSDTAREYRKKYPKKPHLALARILYNENKTLYKDVEDARGKLRYIAGKTGAKNRKNLGEVGKEFVEDTPRAYNPYKLPDSDETSYEPYILQGHKRAAILSDIHAPYHNIEAITKALDFLKKDKPDVVIINGDMWDFHGLSRFLKDPRKKNIPDEINIGVQLLQVVEKVLKCRLIFRKGNHEDRYEHYMWQKLGELNGLEEFEFENIIKKRLPDITVIGDKKIIKLNELNLLHGHEFATSVFSPVNIARGLYLRAKANAMQGHNHATSSHTESDINGRVVTTWSVACLCELHPAYMPINKWNHGFAVVDLDANKVDFEVRNKTIIKGKVY